MTSDSGRQPAVFGLLSFALCQIVDTFRDKRGVDVAGARVNVHKNRDGAFIEDDVGGGDEGEWRRDDQIVFLHAGGDHAQVQAAGAGVDADGVARADVCRARALERLDVRTDAENRRVEHGGDRVHLDLSKVGGGHGNGDSCLINQWVFKPQR
jgi:hypothetical protein